MQYTRVHRLLRLITLIQGSSRLNAKRLAELCETSERNIYRDLKMLEGAGVEILFDAKSGGYAIRRDFFLRPVDLTIDNSSTRSSSSWRRSCGILWPAIDRIPLD